MIHRLFTLKSAKVFGELPTHLLTEILPYFEELKLEANVTIFNQGEIGKSMYLIVGGRVSLLKNNEFIQELNPREVFGELEVLSPRPRVFTVVTMQPTNLLRLDQDILYQLMAENVDIAKNLIGVLINRFK